MSLLASKTGLPVYMETTASTPFCGLSFDISYQRLPCGLARRFGVRAVFIVLLGKD